MKDKKGFTLIEMLGTVVILGILGTIAITGVTKYIASSRDKAYDMLKDTAYEALSNCASESNCILSDNTSFTIADLKALGYIDSFKNPKDESKECSGTVTVQIVESTSTGNIKGYNSGECTGNNSNCINGNYKVEVDEAYNKYLYKVHVECAGITAEDSYYPTGTTKQDYDKLN